VKLPSLPPLVVPLTVVLSQLTVALVVLMLQTQGGFLPEECAVCLAIILPPLAVYLAWVAMRPRQLAQPVAGLAWLRIAGALVLAAAAIIFIDAKANNTFITRPQTLTIALAIVEGVTAIYLGYLIAVPMVGRLDWAKASAPRHAMGTVPAIPCDRNIVRRILTEQFSNQESVLLLRDLGVDPEEVKGYNDTQPLFASEIVEFFERRKRLGELCEAVSILRPDALRD